ncbi:MAG: SBBP repeat-containing protein [Acidobacteriota bacterium]
MRAKKDYGQMPVYFVENRGQLDPRVAYSVQGRDTSIYFEKKGVTFALTEPTSEGKSERAGFRKASLRTDRKSGEESQPEKIKRWAVKLDFVGANPDVGITADQKTPAVISYFKGPKETWKTGLQTYSSITYQELWPGIDLVYSGTANRVKYSFIVKPGADPARVRLAYRGANGVRVNDRGQLEVETPAGGFTDDTPYAYQEIGGRRSAVHAVYALDEAPAGGSRGYGFELGAYDRSQPLVLDPAVLVYAGFIGGNGNDDGHAIAVDSSGNAYVTGRAGSTEATFPVTAGPDLTANGSGDAFVAKVNAAGTALIYAGYIGGSGYDIGYGIAVDSSGNAYVTGQTESTEATFPVTVGPDLSYNGGLYDAFVAKVNAAGTGLLYSGYVGGSGLDIGYGIALNNSGDAYVTGRTSSTEATFPATVGPDTTFNGSTDAFVAKVNAAGTALLYAGYIGGSGFDDGRGIAVDNSGNAYVTGYTASSESTFPVMVGPDLTFNGGYDVFVARVNAVGATLAYAGYIGGSDDDHGYGIAVDGSGNAYVTGDTFSDETTFPVTVGPDLTQNFGDDAFVAKVNATGTALAYAGFIGGSGFDTGTAIAVDGLGNAYVTGYTGSTEATFPVTGGPDRTFNGGLNDAFVAKVNSGGAALLYAGYIGGGGGDYGFGIAVDSGGYAYVTGQTNFFQGTPFPVTVGPDLTQNGGDDAFVAKISNVERGDFNGDGKVDILWRNVATGENTIWLMNGTNVSSLAALPTIPDQGWQVGGVGDLSGDGKNDIVWRNDFTGQNTIWVMNGAALNSQLPLPPVADLNWKIRAVADFDADGKPDLLWRNVSSGQNTVWFMNGPSVTGVATIPGVPDINWEIDGAADFNGDGRSDILWRNLATGQNTMWLMNGTVVASLAAVPPVADLNWRIGGVGDYTNDGQTDILWRNVANGQNTVWVMNGPQVTSAVGVPAVPDLNWRIAGPR